jgi:hypothetical protein
MTPLKTFVSTTALALFLLLVSAVPATAAAPPCWKLVINDWYDGRIDNVYPVRCYREAINHLPEDVETYSSAKDEINRAMLAAIRHDRDGTGGVPTAGGSSGSSPGASGTEGPSGGEPEGGILSRLIDAIGPSNAESVPLPLLILGGIAVLLLGTAGASFVAKRIQARREIVPATAPVRPGPEQS